MITRGCGYKVGVFPSIIFFSIFLPEFVFFWKTSSSDEARHHNHFPTAGSRNQQW
jgi:hypothetical protein